MSEVLKQLKEKRQAHKQVIDGAGAILTKAHAENKRALTPDEEAEFDRRHTEGDVYVKEINRLQKQYETEAHLASVPADNRNAGLEDLSPTEQADLPADYKVKAREFRQLKFRAWACAGGDYNADYTKYLVPDLRDRYTTLDKEIGKIYAVREQRALSAVTGSAGATTIPVGFVYELDTALKFFGGIIEAADYIDTDMGNQLPWPTINDTSNLGQLVAENTAVPGSDLPTSGVAAEIDPTYGATVFNAYMFSTGFVLVPIQLMQDTAFNIDTYLQEQLDIRMGRTLNSYATNGSGSSQPTGVLPAATLGSTSSLAAGISYNDTLNILHSVDPAYRVGPKVGYMFNDATLLLLRKLVDGNGRPLFIAGGTAEGIVNAAPVTLNGYRYWINQDFPSAAATATPMAFGNFQKFKIRRVRQLMFVTAKERFIHKLQFGFIAFQRFDSNLVDAGMHPVKKLQNAAS